jgi:hypothetical protein
MTFPHRVKTVHTNVIGFPNAVIFRLPQRPTLVGASDRAD